MYAFIRGRLEEVDNSCVCLNCNGVGYEIFIPESVEAKLPPIGEELTLYTYLSVREDAHILYGFLSKADKQIFKMLLSVSGIGPKGALSILSVLSPTELRFAILAGDDKQISKAPGIGKKMAQKLIIELKDKIDLGDTLAEGLLPAEENSSDNRNKKDAMDALVALGYSATESMQAVSSVPDVSQLSVEDIIKQALKALAF